MSAFILAAALTFGGCGAGGCSTSSRSVGPANGFPVARGAACVVGKVLKAPFKILANGHERRAERRAARRSR